MISAKTIQSLKDKGYDVFVFSSQDEAREHLDKTIDQKVVGFGGSLTLTNMHLKDALETHNTVYARNEPNPGENTDDMARKALNAGVYILSANAMSEDGVIINIDGNGNRLAGALYGHEKVIYVVSANKIGGTFDEALWRARNIASPKNALRFKKKTPCVMSVLKDLEARFDKSDDDNWVNFISNLPDEELGTHCYDCRSPERICRALDVHWVKPNAMPVDVILIDDHLGF